MNRQTSLGRWFNSGSKEELPFAGLSSHVKANGGQKAYFPDRESNPNRTTRLPGRDEGCSWEERKTAREVFGWSQRQISTSLDHAVRQHSEKHTILVGLDPTTFKMAYSIAH